MRFMKNAISVIVCVLLCTRALASDAASQPNIVYILCDDLGYGDVHCLGVDRSKIATPNMDRLAAAGMTFTEAHSSSAVCTPTRYGILTGRYNWRTQLQKGVLNGYSPDLIEPGRLTVMQILRDKEMLYIAIGILGAGVVYAISQLSRN